MKKFLLGLFCGLALFAATAALAASNEVKALISAISVTFHVNGSTTSLSDEQVLNYNNRLYVPLRRFAEEIGGDIHYDPVRKAADVYVADDRDLDLQDKDGYVNMGHLDVVFADKGEPSTVKGIVKFNRSIPQDKQIVLAIVNGKGVSAAGTEPIRLLNQKVTQSVGGDLAAFEAYFPYMNEPAAYQLEIRIVDKTPWNYTQVNGNVNGAGGIQGYPLALLLSGNVYAPKGTSFELDVLVMNSSDKEVVVTKGTALELEIGQYTADGKRTVLRTLKTQPFSGTIPWKQGALQTPLVWDQKDAKGAVVPPGEYFAELKLPSSAIGIWGETDQAQTFELPSSMKTRVPLFIE